MFDKIGRKVKGLAMLSCIAGILGSVFAGFSTFNTAGNILASLLIMILGAILSWVGSWVCYCIGETCEATQMELAELKEMNRSMQKLLSEKTSMKDK